MTVFHKQLQQAIQARMLEEIKRRAEQQAVVNNIYGGGVPQQSQQPMGIAETMGGDLPKDLADYMVSITRRDLPDINPATGKPVGWEKTVHRYTQPKEQGPKSPSQSRRDKKKRK